MTVTAILLFESGVQSKTGMKLAAFRVSSQHLERVLPSPTGPPTLITYKTCHWRETSATDHMVLRLWFFWLQRQQDVFLLKLNYLITHHSKPEWCADYYAFEREASISELYSQSATPHLETLNRELSRFWFLSDNQVLHWSTCQPTCLPCARDSRGPFLRAGLQLPSPWKAPFLLPRPWALTEPVFCPSHSKPHLC